MSTSDDNQFQLQATGTSDWDTALNANFSKLERGFHVTAQAGIAVNTGQVLWMNSGGFLFPFNPTSLDARPGFMALTQAASGDSILALREGVVRSLGVHSNGVVGSPLYVSAESPGIIVGSYSGASRRIGIKIGGWATMFTPEAGDSNFPEKLSQVTTVSPIVVDQDYDFTIDAGKRGWNRRVFMQGSSDLITLQFFSGSTRANSELLYETFSGGVSVVGSFIDQAGWPYENTEASTISGLIFGRLKIESGSNVESGDIGVTLISERFW
jgi:hypothetical protein